MLFNSWPFFLLVVTTSAIYYRKELCGHQVMILILSSAVFYAWGQPYLLILLILSASITAICSYRVKVETEQGIRLVWALAGVIINLLVLAFFKYNALISSAISQDISQLDGAGQVFLMLPLPIGISFYTFQGISLVIDVLHNRKLDLADDNIDDKESGFGKYYKNTLFYIVFFPQLVAGPIVKAHEFIPQIRQRSYSEIDWLLVVKCLITGYFLKMVLADNIKDLTYWISYPFFLDRSSVELVVGLVAYSAQIFADFAGYSLIAIGIAALFGYRLPQNFNFPYISQSFSEFWRRWHISLSTWLRQYLYIPLGGNRKGNPRTYVNLLAVMGLGGLWHGAAWSYAVWGLCHGLALAIERPFINSWFYTTNNIFVQTVRITLVFSVVTLAWLTFKLPEIEHVLIYLQEIINNTDKGVSKHVLLITLLLITPVFIYHVFYLLRNRARILFHKMEPLLYGLMSVGILFNSGSPHAFIYFQF